MPPVPPIPSTCTLVTPAGIENAFVSAVVDLSVRVGARAGAVGGRWEVEVGGRGCCWAADGVSIECSI